MNCPNCQYPLPPEGADCPDCGIPIPRYESPEGYDYDHQSGLYYHSVEGRDAKSGRRMEYVTWFDPYSGTYEPKEYPLEDARDMPQKDGGNKKKQAGIIAAALVLLLGGTAYAFELHTYIPFIGGSELASAEEAPAQTAADTAEESQSTSIDADASSEPIQEEVSAAEKPLEEPEVEQEPAAAVFSNWQPAVSTGQWFDFPHTSLFYMKTAEDESHVYFLQTHTDGVIGSLYRMDRDGGNMVYIIGDEPGQGVYSFALVDDMIYLAVAADNMHSNYYRVPKTGGEAEFLFQQEHSYMQMYEGELYFIFTQQRSMGIYKPNTDTTPRLTPLIEWEDSSPTDPPSPLSEFSIYEGDLYYADTWEMARGYYRMNLATLDTEILLSGVDLQEFAVCNVVYDGGICYYSHFNDSFTQARIRSAEVGAVAGQSTHIGTVEVEGMFIVSPLIARTNTLLVRQHGTEFYYSQLDNTGTSYPLCSTDAEPCGISSDWVFFSGEVYHLPTGEWLEIVQPEQGPVIHMP